MYHVRKERLYFYCTVLSNSLQQGTFSPRPSYSVIAIGIRQAGGQFWKNLSPLLVSSFCECLCLNILFRFITLSWHLLNVGKSLFIVMLVNTWLPFYSQNQRKDSPNLFSDIASWASRKNLVVYQGSIPYFWVEDIYKPPLLTFWFNSGNYLVQKWLAYAQRYSKSVMYFWNGYDRFLFESCSATQCYSKC